jgi:hypothetical protein
MVGTAVDGQLNAAMQESRSSVRFALAMQADDSAIRRLLRDNPIRGAVTLTLEREPDYFLGSNIAGARDQVIVAFEAGRLICMGRCSTRETWLNGEVHRVGYLAELRLDASAQGRFDVLRDGYRFFHALHASAPADFYFTSIAEDNMRARRLLERGLPGFPRYEHVGNLTTLLVSTRTSRAPALELTSISTSDLTAFLHSAGSHNQLSAAWSADRIRSLGDHDLPTASFGAVRRRGTVVAVAALWDQRRFRQTVIRAYSPALRIARPILNTLGRVFGFPSLPAAGAVLPHASLSPLAIASGNDALLPDLVTAFCSRAAVLGLDYLTLVLPSNDARLALIQRRHRCLIYASRLYRVRWPDERNVVLDSRPILPDVAFL